MQAFSSMLISRYFKSYQDSVCCREYDKHISQYNYLVNVCTFSCIPHRIRIEKSSTSGVLRNPCLLSRSRRFFRARAIVLRTHGVIVETRHITMT